MSEKSLVNVCSFVNSAFSTDDSDSVVLNLHLSMDTLTRETQELQWV